MGYFEGLEGFITLCLAAMITLIAVVVVFFINFLPFVSISIAWAFLVFPASVCFLKKVLH